MIERYVKGRFSHHGDGLSPPEQEAFKDYMYHIIAGRGSGEFALRHLLAPGGWARVDASGPACLLWMLCLLACYTVTSSSSVRSTVLVWPKQAEGYGSMIVIT